MDDREVFPMPASIWEELDQPMTWSDAYRAGGFLFCTGQVGWDKSTGKIVAGGIGAQTRKALENLSDLLHRADGTLEDVVLVRLYLLDKADHDRLDPVYAEFFGTEKPPARVTVVVADLIDEASIIDIEAIAWLPISQRRSE